MIKKVILTICTLLLALGLPLFTTACSSSNSTNNGEQNINQNQQDSSNENTNHEQQQDNNIEVAWNENFINLSEYVAEISDAKALTIKNYGSKIKPATTTELNTNKKYIVKSNEIITQGDTEFDESGLTKITFTKITTTTTKETITGSRNVIAYATQTHIVHIKNRTSNSITINSSTSYQYRLKTDAGEILTDWINGQENETTFADLDYETQNIEIEARNINATLSFRSNPGFIYSIFSGDNCLIESIEDNDAQDQDTKNGMITIFGFIEGETYTINYTGTGEETVITQEEINGEIDKLYVCDNYTFISFVPINANTRPLDQDLIYGDDGIAIYDRTNYYSDNTRQSFVINNITGYIYKIENFSIREIKNGLILSNNDNYVYDFKINDEEILIFYSLFQNDSIHVDYFFKDVYGNNFISNNKINQYDPTTNTHFFVYHFGNSNDKGNYQFELTETKETICIEYDPDSSVTVYKSVTIVLPNNQRQILTLEDCFKINNYQTTGFNWYKIEDGILYGYYRQNYFGDSAEFGSAVLNTYDFINDIASSYNLGDAKFNFNYLKKYGILITYNDNKVGYYNDFYSVLNTCDVLEDHYVLLIENCVYENYAFLTYGINGNTYYDIIVEEIDSALSIKKYIAGTYTTPQIIIEFQPINRK